MVKQLCISVFKRSSSFWRVLPVLKHFPGHGRSLVDTHHNPSEIRTDLKNLMERRFIPF